MSRSQDGTARIWDVESGETVPTQERVRREDSSRMGSKYGIQRQLSCSMQSRIINQSGRWTATSVVQIDG